MMFVAWLSLITGAFAEQPVSMTELVGTWRTPCIERSGGSSVSQLEFNIRGELKNTSRVFLGGNCASPYMTAGASFGFALDDGRLSGTATPTAATLMFESSDAVAAANAGAGVCGITDWALNVARPILGLPCSPGGAVKIGVGKTDPRTLRVSECASPNACTTTDYTKID